MISSIFHLKLLILLPLIENFLCIPVFAADGSAVNPSGIKKPLANALSTFFIKDKQVFNNCPIGLTRNPTDCTILNR